MFTNRIKNIQEKLKEAELDGLLVTSVSNISYLTGGQAFSIEEREAYVLVTQKNLYLFTDRRYTDAFSNVTHLTLIEISSENKVSDQLKNIITKHSIKHLGFEKENLTYSEFEKFQEKLKAAWIPTENIVEEARITKDEEELTNLKKAAHITDLAFSYIVKKVRVGVSELELAADLEYFMKKQGGGVAFSSIVAFGTNSAIPHHHTSDKKLTKKDHVVLFDIGASWNGYCADMTRTVFIGNPSTQLSNMYETVKTAQEKALEFLRYNPILSVIPAQQSASGGKTGIQNQARFRTKSGMTKKGSSRHSSNSNIKVSQVDQAARKYIIQQGYPSIPHSVGHGIGLQVHELPHISPGSDFTLRENIVFTVEPGIYNIKVGGVRIEDDVLITKNGIEVLTKSSKEMIKL